MYVALIAVCAVIVFQIIKIYKANKLRDETLSSVRKSAIQTMDCSKEWTINQIAFLAIVIGFAVYIYLNPSSIKSGDANLYIAVLGVFAISVLINMLMNRKEQCLYYTKEVFYNDGKMIRFKNVKSIQKARTNGAIVVNLYSNDPGIKVTKGKSKAIKSLCNI
jgi:predicted histidine transporter YuiF (NhaC family)